MFSEGKDWVVTWNACGDYSMFDLDVASLLTPNMILNKVGTGFFLYEKRRNTKERAGFTNQSYHVNKYGLNMNFFSIIWGVQFDIYSPYKMYSNRKVYNCQPILE